MNKKINDIEEEQRKVRKFEKMIRLAKEQYIQYRREYIEEHEGLIACCYHQCRNITNDERAALCSLYNRYIKKYFYYLELKKRCSRYLKSLDWLRTI